MSKKISIIAPLFLGFLFVLFTAPLAKAAQFNVSIVDDYFQPFAPIVLPEDTVTWTNTGNSTHSVTADDSSFDSGSIAPGGTYSHTFTGVGIVNYYCKLHSKPASQGGNAMNAVILVNSLAPASLPDGSTGTPPSSTSTPSGNPGTPPATSTGLQYPGLSSGLTMPGNEVSYNMTTSNPGSFVSGSLVNDSGTIFLIRGTVKIPFTNYNAFKGLGFSMKNVVNGDTAGYTPSSYNISSGSAVHPWGSWLVYQGTIYYSHQSGLIGVPSYEIFTAHGGKSSLVLPANAADIAVLNSSKDVEVLKTNDTRLY